MINAKGASTSQRGIKIDTGTTGTGTPFELETGGTDRVALEIDDGFFTSSVPTATTTKYLIITIDGTAYRIKAESSS